MASSPLRCLRAFIWFWPCHPMLAPPRVRLAVWLHCPGGFRPRTAARPAPAPVEYPWRNTGPVHELSMSDIDRCVFMSRGHGGDCSSYVRPQDDDLLHRWQTIQGRVSRAASPRLAPPRMSPFIIWTWLPGCDDRGASRRHPIETAADRRPDRRTAP